MSTLPQNQNNSRAIVHIQQQHQSGMFVNNVTPSVIGNSTATLANHLNPINSTNSNSNPTLSIQSSNNVSAVAAQMIQNQISAVIHQQQQHQQHPHHHQQNHQQQHQHKMLHKALTRTASHQPRSTEMLTLMNTLMENMNGHRKLERTQSEPAPQVNTSRYKTELCRPFEEAGVCKYAEKCQFAHGAHELRNLQRHPKYKTEYCRTFHSVGFCPYGPRCHFVHNEEDAPLPNRSVQGNFTRVTALNHQLPMSPPLSMSTGSDRASPTGSLSPTSSMASFPFDQNSPTLSGTQPFTLPAAVVPSSVIYSQSSLNISPPASPVISATPPPTPTILSVTSTNSQTSSKTNSVLSVGANTVNGAATATPEENRLPIFNQISCSTLEAL